MIYCDTSLLVASVAPEASTSMVQQWLGKQSAGALCVSGWVVTEFSSALSIKLRSGNLTLDQRASIMTHWRLMLAENLVIVPVPQTAFDLAARFADQHNLNIRAGDALHLAIAFEAGLALATLDQTMARAAGVVGLSVSAVGI